MRKILAAVMLVAATSGITSASAQGGGVYEGRIDGEFTGWEGETVYRLMDGHIIQQAEYYYHYRYAYSPRVIIYNSNGSLKINVEGVPRDVRINILR